MLEVLAATSRTQGYRDLDFTGATVGELVDLAPSPNGSTASADLCRTGLGFLGLDSRRVTTTAEIVERDLTAQQYRSLFHDSLVRAGLPADDAEIRDAAYRSADQLLRVASAWPVGTVVESAGDTVRVRAWPLPRT